MTGTQLRVHREKDGISCFRQSDVDGVISGEVIPQFPDSMQQWGVRIALNWETRESFEKQLASMRIDASACV